MADESGVNVRLEFLNILIDAKKLYLPCMTIK